ncbi:MAG TPA: general stress protein [Soehngenia sp.]|nr:general stress protein [Soehngenia sp.]HPP30953.1 general stress protein [Soehngenia sp.]
MLDKKIEVFEDELSLLKRITELELLGYEEQDMYVIANKEENISMIKGSTDVLIKEDDVSLWDRFKSFLSGEDSVIDALNRLELSEEEKKKYYDEVKNGRLVLLVDPNYKSKYELREDGFYYPVESDDEKKDIDDLPDDLREDVGLNPKEDDIDIGKEVSENILRERQRGV